MTTDGFDDNPLTPTESLDSDEVRNADGDEVVDPPERWIEAEEHESLDERLADEVPDRTADGSDGSDDSDDSSIVLTSDDALDHLDPQQHGRDEGQIDGAPEDGESFFSVEE